MQSWLITTMSSLPLTTDMAATTKTTEVTKKETFTNDISTSATVLTTSARFSTNTLTTEESEVSTEGEQSTADNQTTGLVTSIESIAYPLSSTTISTKESTVSTEGSTTTRLTTSATEASSALLSTQGQEIAIDFSTVWPTTSTRPMHQPSSSETSAVEKSTMSTQLKNTTMSPGETRLTPTSRSGQQSTSSDTRLTTESESPSQFEEFTSKKSAIYL
ncbi:hypothetical protein COOONC_16566 [Cooperia oncophora]